MSTPKVPGNKTSRRGFLGAAATAGAALSAPLTPAAAAQAKAESPAAAPAAAPRAAGTTGVAIPSSVTMNSGAPLGGIGTGFLEIRPDGGFYEWQIFNVGAWGGSRGGPGGGGAAAGPRPQYLRFLLRTAGSGGASPKLRRLYLNAEENNLYSQPFVHDVQSIEYDAWFPMTNLRYNDPTLPVRVSAAVFSPFIPGKARDSATPGFHMVFTLENTSGQAVEASLVSLLENPLVTDAPDRMLTNTVSHDGPVTSLTMKTGAQPEDKSGVGSLCLAISGGEHSWIAGTYQQYASFSNESWNTQRTQGMGISLDEEIYHKGKLPNTEGSHDPYADFKLKANPAAGGGRGGGRGGAAAAAPAPPPAPDDIDRLSASEADDWMRRLSGDALIHRVFADAQLADPQAYNTLDGKKVLLREVARNITPPTPPPAGAVAGGRGGGGFGGPRLTWGTGALASTVKLAPGQRQEVRVAVSWYFPHHMARVGGGFGGGRGAAPGAAAPTPPPAIDIGHMYANWFSDAADVNKYMQTNYAAHRKATELFARTLTDTSLGKALSFAWSAQLGTLVKSTWWLKAGQYAIWEGMGCCGHSTTDVDYQGSHSVLALFPELRLEQSKHMIKLQNDQGQVPHCYQGDLDHVDNGFNRVDMNPQWVMMACRDYMWTGDKAYLQEVYPHVVKAMDYTGSLDTDGDGLPDTKTSVQTYDGWAMRGAPSYVASLWLGGLKAAIRMAQDMGQTADATRWKAILDKASPSFDKVLFNGEYYKLWVDGAASSNVCMSDQISGEWFMSMLGWPTTISEKNLAKAIDSIVKFNYDPEFGLHNATSPKGGQDLLAATNNQAGGLWTGIEYAFASFLMDLGRFADAVKVVETVHLRYLRAGRPFNHIECGDHYSRPPASWLTMSMATGFKPDLPKQTLAIIPKAPGDFHAPWALVPGFGKISRSGETLSVACSSGKLTFKKLQVKTAAAKPTVTLAGKALEATATKQGTVTTLEFAQPVSIEAGQTLTIA
jgi:uncharacterized protein (DUF608 family)